MTTVVYGLYAKNDNHLVDLFPTEALAHSYTGTMNRPLYYIEPLKRDVAFVVMERGDHYDGGDKVKAVCHTYTAALRVVTECEAVDVKDGYPVGYKDYDVDVYEVQR